MSSLINFIQSKISSTLFTESPTPNKDLTNESGLEGYWKMVQTARL